jgi:hypothetical protein
VFSIKGTNPSQCRYFDGSCSLLVHRECAIECCRAVGIFYTLEDGKSARCPHHHEGFKKKIDSSQENDNNSGNRDEIDQRNDSNEGKCKEGSSDEGQKDDKSKKKKRANVNVHDEESGKDGGTEVADQIKSSCNLNDDGGKNNQGKKVQLRGVVRRILVLKLKTAKETLMEFMNALMEIMLLEKIMKNTVPIKIIIMVGTVMRSIK